MIHRAALLLTVAAAASCVSAGLAEARQALARRQKSVATVNSLQNWSNDFADLDFDTGANGSFSVDWDNGFGGNFVVGRGYQPARDMLVNYTGAFHTTGAAYLALYGWTRNPLVEYYVIEAMGNHNPSDNVSSTQYGCLQSDGGTYEIWQKERINAPSIEGEHTNFQQYWSVRTSMHVGGTINTGNHFRAWEAAGLKLGTQLYMDIVIEGQKGSGSANITVGQRPTTNVPNTPTPTRRTEHAPGTCPRTTGTVTATPTAVPTSA
ncbi:concanavalin A-like lectin/glucanase domain-containing protein [Xylariaceae sp. AK1471]|nr:concanavalin A-like lectin/glucanase domain-containing protein [Xylariaceae sp. AK1471]